MLQCLLLEFLKNGVEHSFDLEQLVSHVFVLFAVVDLVHLLLLADYYLIYLVYDIRP